MSGGVDSSVAAALLLEKGYDVIGVTLRIWPHEKPCDDMEAFGTCCSPQAIEDARSVAAKLNIPFYVLNFEEEFRDSVISDFEEEYLRGRTPNPCIVCNKVIRFDSLLNKAISWGVKYIATGHYAKISLCGRTNRLHLLRGEDRGKDQSYFLYCMSQYSIAHTMFPIGEYRKIDVRRIARKMELPVADKPESQDVCFVSQKNYREYFLKRMPSTAKTGEILDVEGRVIGKHQGFAFYTVGQRKGIGIARSHPLYVLRIDPEKNQIVVGSEEELFTIKCFIKEFNFIPFDRLEKAMEVSASIRYRHLPAPAVIKPCDDSSIIELEFLKPQRAICPGQSAVFYEGDMVIGGGIIV